MSDFYAVLGFRCLFNCEHKIDKINKEVKKNTDKLSGVKETTARVFDFPKQQCVYIMCGHITAKQTYNH